MIPTPAKRRVHQQSMDEQQSANTENSNSNDDLKPSSPEQVTLFNTLMSAKRAELLMSSVNGCGDREQEMFDEEEIIDEEEDLEYLRLDTIVEEDENCCSADEHNFATTIDKISRAECDTSLTSLSDKQRFHLSSANAPTTNATAEKVGASSCCETHADLRGPMHPVRPQAVKQIATTAAVASAKTQLDGADFDDHYTNIINNNNHNKNSQGDNNVPAITTTIDRLGSRPTVTNYNKMEQQQQQANKKTSPVVSSQPLPLPSTNRLISEHQARQKQALFRCLAERQKMLDESGQRPLDLMSAASLKSLGQQQCSSSASVKSSSSSRTASRRRHSGAAAHGGVPLSAVDLNSISDVQIDELLGRIASASSSSLSSNGESLDSSDLSNLNSEDSDDSTSASEDLTSASDDLSSSGDEHRKRHRRRRGNKTKKAAAAAAAVMDAPNVIGVHEDGAPTSANQRGGGRNQVNCRDSHRLARPGNRSTDHDDDDDHELLSVRPNNNGFANSSSLSPLPGGNQQHQSLPRGEEEAHLERSKLEQYFTNNLVNPHEFGYAPSSSDGEPKPSVEDVLARMLHALNDIGPNEQERVTELIERDFVQLEQLLSNYSLQAASATQKQPLNSQRSQQAQQPNNLAQKLISCQQQLQVTGNTLMSKDSDYGSDTQSADCFSQCNEQANSNNNKWLTRQSSGATAADQLNNSDSPSPTSLATTTSSSGVSTSTTNKQQQTLSPLAIELSFKLAETLQRLAQQRRGGSQVMQDSSDDEADEPDTVRVVSASNEQQQVVDEDFPDAGRTSVDSGQVVPQTPRDKPRADETQSQPIKAKRSPMKSIVLINANRSPSAASIVSAAASNSSPVGAVLETCVGGEHRNLTPVNGMVIGSNCVSAAPKAADQLPGANQQQAGELTNLSADKVAPLSSNGKPLTSASRQPFKTRVNINSSTSAQRVLVSATNVIADQEGRAEGGKKLNVSAAASPSPSQASRSQSKQQDNTKASEKIEADLKEKQVTASKKLNLKQQEADEEEGQAQSAKSATVNQSRDTALEVEPTSAAAASGKPIQQAGSNFVRRRSARSSLRRRPSYTGSISSLVGGADQAAPRQPRPGSPLPRPLLSQVTQAGAGECETMQREQQPANQQHQLQRALILAQKYNYSPAKLAASKLSQKLLLASGSESSPQGIYTSTNGSQTLNSRAQEQQQKLPAGKTAPTGATDNKRRIVVTGQVQLDISYEAKSGSLTVHVMRCNQLAPVSKRRTTSNPYVKLYLLPDRSKSGKRKSSILRSELDPEFNEDFTFGPIQLADFDRRLLWLSVWHKDRLGRNEFLGELRLPMSQVRSQLLTSDSCQSTAPKWYKLSDRQRETGTLERKTNPAPKSQANDLAKEQQVADKLGELQRKAARLSTVMASSSPSGGAAFPAQMNCTLGPLPGGVSLNGAGDSSADQSSATITGKLFVALKFVPDNQDLGLATIGTRTQQNMIGELQVMVKEARNIAGFDMGPLHQPASSLDSASLTSANGTLRAPPAGALPNPFCKCYLLSSSGQRLAKQKTATLKRTANPRWDHKCVFPALKLGQLASQAIEIHMFNRDQSILVSSSSNQCLGAVRLCKGANQQAASADVAQPDSESIASDQSISEHSERLSRQNSSASHSNTSQTTASRRSITTIEQQHLKEPEGSLCTERESRLWSQVLQRPGIWVYGELRLRQLRPLVVLEETPKQQSSSAANKSVPQRSAGVTSSANGSYNPTGPVSASVY